MGHYDLYASLRVSRGYSCEQLSEEITRRLQTGQTTNPGGPDELRVALAVLGSPGRRAQYDAVLDSPDAAPLTPADVANLAAMPDQPGPQINQSAPQAKKESKAWPVLAAAVAVVALIFAAATAFFLIRDNSDDETAIPGETSTSDSADAPDPTPSGGSDPRQMVDEYMALETRDERAEWIKQHTDFDLIREKAEGPMSDVYSLETFALSQADAYSQTLGESNSTPKKLEEYVLSEEEKNPFSNVDTRRWRDLVGRDTSDSYEAMFESDTGTAGIFTLQKREGVWFYVSYQSDLQADLAELR